MEDIVDIVDQVAAAMASVAVQPTRISCATALVRHVSQLARSDDVSFVGHGAYAGIEIGVDADSARSGVAALERGNRLQISITASATANDGDVSLGELWFGTPVDGSPGIELARAVIQHVGAVLAVVAEREQLDDRVRIERELIEAGKSLSQEVTLEGILRRIIERACSLVDARYGALGVVNGSGEQLAAFITVGIDDATRDQIGELPTGRGILGVLVRDPKPLRLARISDDPRSVGFPEHHPPMRSFLGVPIVSRGLVKGRIYLAERRGAAEFSDQDEWVAVMLASQAAIAIESMELYESATSSARDLAAANAQLEDANRHKSAFLANMSHELRTPLNSILGYAMLLLEGAENLSAEQLDDLQAIGSSGRHLLSLISDLLDLSKIEAGKLELRLASVDIAQLLRDTVTSLRPQVRRTGVELLVEAPGSLVVECDRSRVRQIFLNVLGNAVKFTEHGQIVARVQAHADGGARCEFHDSGPGIPEEDIERVFESFFQSTTALAHTSRRSEGAGLGLAITRTLVDLHGGEIWIKSTLGVGTTVTIDLPARVSRQPGEAVGVE